MIPIARPAIGKKEEQAVLRVLRSGNLAQGREVELFEREFSEYTGARYAVAFNSGTSALHAALLAHGIGRRDKVITTPFTFVATASTVRMTGAEVVFADVEPDTFNISPEAVEEAAEHGASALVAVHLFGHPADITPLRRICRKHGLVFIEDACQAHGAMYRGKRVGTFGTAAFSFYPTKNMTTGEGGMVTTSSRETAERLRLIRNHCSRVRYRYSGVGYNYRMTDIAAAIGRVQLRRLEAFNRKRRENAGYLTEMLQGSAVVPPVEKPYAHHVYHQYTVRIPGKRDTVRKRMAEAGIGTGVYYPVPLHMQEPYRTGRRFPEAERAAREVLSLPVYPGLTRSQLRRIAAALRECVDV